ncbi:hypothetical protein CFBP6109_01918 [Pseudomonas syringae pv. cerasicola]|nr:hypothetical protein AO252_12015 [Pseudomonas syringae pv. cerasicola]SOS16549.1 hypothetical protein CFBP6109_01918 [Pseudomonas syringae pv. cerasicola]SPF15806.1 hypothetical protein PSCFBP6110_03314 [Pseudomonas syringae pv. cerasicola]
MAWQPVAKQRQFRQHVLQRQSIPRQVLGNAKADHVHCAGYVCQQAPIVTLGVTACIRLCDIVKDDIASALPRLPVLLQSPVM